EEAEREGDEPDGDERPPEPDGVPVRRPADQADEPEPGGAEERRRPEHAQPTGRGEAVDAGGRRRSCVHARRVVHLLWMDGVAHLACATRYCTSWSSLSGGIWSLKFCGITPAW